MSKNTFDPTDFASCVCARTESDDLLLDKTAGSGRVTLLKGFSGCRIALIEQLNGSTFVRKISYDLLYNDRLIKQINKQRTFGSNIHCRAINIISSGYLESGLAYADMMYVPGITAAQMLSIIPLKQIPQWSDLLLNIAIPENPVSQSNLPEDLFINKIMSLEKQLSKKQYSTPNVKEAMRRLSLQSWHNIPSSRCHGDLTLENIIIHNGEFFLLDFLDSFADSWFVDVAKLMQDFIARWSFRHGAIDRNLALRLAAVRFNIESRIRAQYPGTLATIHALYVLALIRILPYANDLNERKFIDGCVFSALNEIL